MPAQKLNEKSVQLACFDVVGKYGSSIAQFVDHVGLVREIQASVVKGQSVPVCHMLPPLESSQLSVDVHATPVLTRSETEQIRRFWEMHRGEHESNELIKGRGKGKAYTIFPHVSLLREEDGTYAAKRFNCVGFVIEAYRDAGIDFIDTRPDHLPKISYEVLKNAYPIIASKNWVRANEQFKLGLDTSIMKWPVVLPAYVFHALDRSDVKAIRDTPYCPQVGDECFPTPRAPMLPDNSK